jgi:two-component system, chemotaxis family, chemotaxis protein CheY
MGINGKSDESTSRETGTLSILVVDDCICTRRMVGLVLQKVGYDVVEACDGLDALGKLDGRRFHLIVSDLDMPNMDGIAFTKAAKELPAHRSTPIVVLTAEHSEQKKSEGTAAGVHAWLLKPFHPASLLEAMYEIFGTCS